MNREIGRVLGTADAQPLTLANPDRETLVYWLGTVPEPLHVAAMLGDHS